MTNAQSKTSTTPSDDDLFRPAGLLVIGPWNWCARPKPERRKPRRGAEQLRLALDTFPPSKKDRTQ